MSMADVYMFIPLPRVQGSLLDCPDSIGSSVLSYQRRVSSVSLFINYSSVICQTYVHGREENE